LSFGKKTQRLLRSREPWWRTTERTLLLRRNGEFESTSLQQWVSCEPDFLTAIMVAFGLVYLRVIAQRELGLGARTGEAGERGLEDVGVQVSPPAPTKPTACSFRRAERSHGRKL
jgi:hypothetical protein